MLARAADLASRLSQRIAVAPAGDAVFEFSAHGNATDRSLTPESLGSIGWRIGLRLGNQRFDRAQDKLTISHRAGILRRRSRRRQDDHART